MRSRTFREGSVGLLILLGLITIGALVIWIRGFRLGSRSYEFTATFEDAGGVQVGSAVRYRGVVVGRVSSVSATGSAAEVEIEIRPATLEIPMNSVILTNQTGLIGEATIDIIPPPGEGVNVATNPLADDCESSGIICNGDRVSGQVGATFNELIAATITLADLFADQELFDNIVALTGNTSEAAEEVARLADSVTVIAESVQDEVEPLLQNLNVTTTRIGQAATQAGVTANELNRLLESNRGAIVATLDNLNRTTGEISYIVGEITPLVEDDGLVDDLELLVANASDAAASAAEASASLSTLSTSIATDENILLLQETLDSARATFQNVQKITADLDELTGDPELRDSLRELIRSLSDLVSSTEDLQNRAAIAQTLAPAEHALRTAEDRLRYAEIARRSAESTQTTNTTTQEPAAAEPRLR
ncbi:MlaD family protein [Vacuolonema iberomarrocanum]|uniref:MlaD family protein n=1 Tax=Vacuolonema iberomarrocanum TaxID=3454632 RepID=UPI0019FC4DB0|nr:MCE family protein [filamentous cyanobacterium LEGE 07170]